MALDDLTAEVCEVIGEIRRLSGQVMRGEPTPDHDEVMARKRAVIERIEPGFYDNESEKED